MSSPERATDCRIKRLHSRHQLPPARRASEPAGVDPTPVSPRLLTDFANDGTPISEISSPAFNFHDDASSVDDDFGPKRLPEDDYQHPTAAECKVSPQVIEMTNEFLDPIAIARSTQFGFIKYIFL